jgi:hypothetical protein
MPEPSSGSVTCWLRLLPGGDPAAAQQLIRATWGQESAS